MKSWERKKCYSALLNGNFCLGDVDSGVYDSKMRFGYIHMIWVRAKVEVV